MLPNNRKVPLKWLITMLALLLLALPLVACGKDNDEDNKSAGSSKTIVATYTGGQVTEKELTEFMGAHEFFSQDPMYPYYKMMPDFKESLLRQLIATRLLGAELDESKRKETAKQAKDDINEMDKSIKSDANSKEQFAQIMSELNIKLDDLRTYMESQYNMQEYFDKKYTEEDAKKEYDVQIAKDKNAFISIATVRHVLVATADKEGKELRTKEEALKRAQEAYQKLKNGGDWVVVAKEYSDDEGSVEAGGQYVDAEVTQWVENFREHAINQPIDELGEPFETEFGYHVMLVENRNPNDFASVKNNVKIMMINNFFANYLQEELDKLNLKITLPQEEAEAPADDNTNADTDGDAGGSEKTE